MAKEMHVTNEDKKLLIRVKMEVNIKKKKQFKFNIKMARKIGVLI
jgi:hypothetical protein